ncbi:MAG: DUF1501 domain-containing protein [Saprospiraceae bacterium]|uniref:DUF1501 domain-containing protein n=1 Tax=Candidatus Brachybacter algidus TaxID=2982024 RepID=UPI00257D559E|nr:DUF1501 domain-containing protein [Candidatus Brachybacter algidus]MBK7603823.1 DUF1501 domain-containing protein [Candidatus Brachybacter algidus]
MKRRSFIKSLPIVSIPAIIPGLSMHALTSKSLLNMLPAVETDRVLVMIQFAGGCDGLNMVFPRDQYTNLANARSNIIIPESSILGLNGNNATGLHPKMAEFRNMYDEGKVSIVQSVAYANQNFSHFRSTDIWMSGSDSGEVLNTGWSGRYLENEYPGAPNGYPNPSMTDPLAIQIGNSVSQVFWGNDGVLGYSLENTSSFYNLINGIQDSAPDTYYGDELTYIRQVALSANAYATAIQTASNNVTQQYTGYPSSNTLADHLKIVARLIKGGLKTRLYLVTLNGFDTHSNQINTTDPTTGTMPNILEKFSKAVDAFQKDLSFLQIDKRVLGMTFSEFGRRVKSNDSLGTDHGIAAPTLLFGSNVNGGIVGSNPVIPTVVNSNTNVTMQFDYRQVYTTLLKDWFCAPAAEINAVFDETWSTLPLVNPNVADDCLLPPLSVEVLRLKAETVKAGYHSLSWYAKNPVGVQKFVLQHSSDGFLFDDIKEEKVFEGVDNKYEYQFLYKYPQGRLHYYRVKMVENDGKIEYSNLEKLQVRGIDLSIYPNPAKDWFNIRLNDKDTSNIYTVEVTDIKGNNLQLLKLRWDDFSGSIYRLSLNNYVSGQYIVFIVDRYGEKYQQKLTVLN